MIIYELQWCIRNITVSLFSIVNIINSLAVMQLLILNGDVETYSLKGLKGKLLVYYIHFCLDVFTSELICHMNLNWFVRCFAFLWNIIKHPCFMRSVTPILSNDISYNSPYHLASQISIKYLPSQQWCKVKFNLKNIVFIFNLGFKQDKYYFRIYKLI